MENLVFLDGVTPNGERVVLRPVDMDDLDLCLQWYNDPELRSVMGASLPMSRSAEREWLERVTKHQGQSPEHLVFMIVFDRQPVGTIGLHEINLVHRRAVIGIRIGEKDYRGRKIGRTAQELIIRYAFNELNLLRLRANIYEGNVPSIRIHEACGYRLAGRLPHWHFKDGQWKDDLIYVLSRDDWIAQRKA